MENRSGCSLARLKRVLWEHEIAGSSPAIPTMYKYITEYKRVEADGSVTTWAGPEVFAFSEADAVEKCEKLGLQVTVVGRLMISLSDDFKDVNYIDPQYAASSTLN